MERESERGHFREWKEKVKRAISKEQGRGKKFGSWPFSVGFLKGKKKGKKKSPRVRRKKERKERV